MSYQPLAFLRRVRPTRAPDPMPEPVLPELQVFRLPHASKLPLPQYAMPTSAGITVHAALHAEFLLFAGRANRIPTGFRIAVPPGWALHARCHPRLEEKRVALVAPATIDGTAMSEIVLTFHNFGEIAVRFREGDAIALLVASPVSRLTIRDTP